MQTHLIGIGHGSSTAILSTAILSTLGSSNLLINILNLDLHMAGRSIRWASGQVECIFRGRAKNDQGWHSKVKKKIASKNHLNHYEIIELFKN